MAERKFTESRLEEPTTQSSIQARQEDLGVVEQPVDNVVEQTTTQVTDAEVERATDSLESGVDRLIEQQDVQAPEVEPVQAPQEDVQVQQLKQEEPKIEPIEPVKAPKIEPVQDVQVVESNKLTNESNREKLELQKEQKATTQFSEMLRSGATNEELSDFVNSNPQFKKSFNSIVRDTFKTRANTQFFSQYNGMSNEAMDAAVKEGKLVPGSNQYNLLSEQQRARYEAYAKREEAITLPQKTDFTAGDNVQSLEGIVAEVQKLFSTNLRDKSKELFTSPAIQEATSAISTKKLEIEKLDIKLEDIEDQMRKKLGDDGFSPAYINSAIRDEKNALIKEKRLLVAEYNSRLGEYQNLKSDAQQELEFYKYEDAQAKQVYNTALGLYESRRKEALSARSAAEEREYEIKKLEFIEENKRIASQEQQAFNIQLREIDQKFKQDNLEPEYRTDRDGNLVVIVDGQSQKVRDASGNVLGIERTKDYTDTVEYNEESGTKIVTRTYDDGSGRLPDTFVTAIDGSSEYNTNMGAFDIISQIPTKGRHPSGGLWCGEFTDMYVSKGGLVSSTTGKPVDVSDSYESKKEFINNASPQVGGLAVWNPSPEGEYGENGHIGIVTGYNPSTGMVEITDTNSQGNGQKRTYTIPVSQVNNSDGGFVHLKNPNAPKDTPKQQFSQGAEDWAKNIANGSATIANVPSELRTEVSSALANRDISLDPDNPIVQSLKSQFDIIDDIVDWKEGGTPLFGDDTKNESIIEAISGARQFSSTEFITGSKGQMLSKIQFLLDEQPLNKLIEVKAQGATFGALSNAELALLTKSASLLNSAAQRNEAGELTGFKLSEADLKKNLRILRDGYSKTIQDKTGIQDIDLEQELLQGAGAALPSGNDIGTYFE